MLLTTDMPYDRAPKWQLAPTEPYRTAGQWACSAILPPEATPTSQLTPADHAACPTWQ